MNKTNQKVQGRHLRARRILKEVLSDWFGLRFLVKIKDLNLVPLTSETEVTTKQKSSKL